MIDYKTNKRSIMISLPQHPVHYVFGMTSHAPLAIKAWIQEDFTLKSRFFLWYVAFFFWIGSLGGGFLGGATMAGIIVLTTFVMAFPSAVFDPSDSKFIPSISNAFFNGILSFHGFLITYFVIYNVVSIAAFMTGHWTLATSNALMATSGGLMVGFSVQQIVATNARVPWFSVPIISIGIAYGIFKTMMPAA